MFCAARALMVSQRPVFGSRNRTGTERESATKLEKMCFQFPSSRSVPGTPKPAWIKAFKSISLVSLPPHRYSLLDLYGLVFTLFRVRVCPPRNWGTEALAETNQTTTGGPSKCSPDGCSSNRTVPHADKKVPLQLIQIYGVRFSFKSFSKPHDDPTSRWCGQRPSRGLPAPQGA
jgi:hypothetical protein